MDHHCNNLTDRRILTMFLNICNDLSNLCHKLETLHPGNSTTNEILERCKLLLNHSNDLSTIRAKYVLLSAEFCGGHCSGRLLEECIFLLDLPVGYCCNTILAPPCYFCSVYS